MARKPPPIRDYLAGAKAPPPEVDPVPQIQPEDEEFGEMPLYRPSVPGETPIPAIQDAQDGDEPFLPLALPEEPVLVAEARQEALRAHLDATAAAVLSHMADPLGKDEVIKWAARIEVLQAYCFDGRLATAPAWIDRNWLAWDDGAGIKDSENVQPGPALNVTRADGTHVGLVRRGDYVVRQNTTVDDPAVPGGMRVLPDHLAVMPKAEFERLFRPVKAPVTSEQQAA